MERKRHSKTMGEVDGGLRAAAPWPEWEDRGVRLA